MTLLSAEKDGAMTTRALARLLLTVPSICSPGGLWAGAQPLELPAIRVRLEPVMQDTMSGVAWNAMTAGVA
jgi:hypothetical protein